MFTHNIDPVLFELGFLQIRYYGLFYIFGLIFAYFIILKVSKERGLGLQKEDVLDYIVYLAIGILVGGRLGYFLFYNISDVISDPLELLRIWHGGMSFHGGLLGTIAAGYLYSRKKGVKLFDLADITVIPLGMALALGRFGNFINAELVGRPTSLPWAFDFGDGIPRHPSQLYESAKNLVIFATLWNLRKIRLPRGFLFFTFIAMYGFLRFWIEFVRQPDPQLGLVLGPLSMGQLLCLPMFVGGIGMMYLLYKEKIKL